MLMNPRRIGGPDGGGAVDAGAAVGELDEVEGLPLSSAQALARRAKTRAATSGRTAVTLVPRQG
jgi:hypothetical protein